MHKKYTANLAQISKVKISFSYNYCKLALLGLIKSEIQEISGSEKSNILSDGGKTKGQSKPKSTQKKEASQS